MIVSTRDGRHHSTTTRNERFQKFLKKWETLSDSEKEAVTELVNEIRTLNEEGMTGFEDLNELLGTHPSYNEIAENHYVGNVISIDEFVKDDYYLGVTGQDLYPKWLADLKEFYKGQYTEAIISGSIGSGKTSWTEFALLRMFYELTMLKDPQSTFGLMPGSEIVLVCFNRDDGLARRVTYGGVKAKLEQSSYFKDIGCKIGKSETVYPASNISIIAVSARSAKALGRNVFGGIIDETDFLDGSSISGKERAIAPGEKPFAERLHSSILRRMKSRYDRVGVMPGKLMMSSSAKNVDSFTNRRIGLAINDPSVFCRDYAIYDVKPAHHFSPVRFWVLVGNAQIRHQILTDEEYEGLGKAGRAKKEREGCKFIHVPDNFRADFERNIEDSIRDIGGIVTVSVSIFIQLRDKIYEAIDPGLKHPVKTEVWVTDKPPPIDWSMLCHKVEKRLELGYRETSLEPIRHPESLRHVHIDLSLGRQDAAGLCIAHVVDVIDVERRGADGHIYVEPAPLIEVDLLLRIEAPRNGEIDIGSVRGLVYHFMDHGFSFGFASMDSFQSAESLQKFRQQGIAAEVISVDSKYDPYDYLKLALYEGRVSYYRYPWLLTELEKLERDLTKGMIIHSASGSKDVSDSLAGCCYSLNTKLKHRAPIDIGISEYEGAEKDDEWIRQTMVRTGKEAPRQVGKFPGKNPLISME